MATLPPPPMLCDFLEGLWLRGSAGGCGVLLGQVVGKDSLGGVWENQEQTWKGLRLQKGPPA